MHASGQRQPFVAAAAVLSVVLGVGASILLSAAFGFDLPAFADPGSFVDNGVEVARLLRWGALDMAIYLPWRLWWSTSIIGCANAILS